MLGPPKKPKAPPDPYADIAADDPYGDIPAGTLHAPAAAVADASASVPASVAKAKGLGDLSLFDTGRAAVDAAGLGFPSRAFPGLLEGVNQNNRLAGTALGSMVPGIPVAKATQVGGAVARFLKGAIATNAMGAVSAGNHAPDGERNAAAVTAVADPRTALLGGGLAAAPRLTDLYGQLQNGAHLTGELPDNILSLRSLWKSLRSVGVEDAGAEDARAIAQARSGAEIKAYQQEARNRTLSQRLAAKEAAKAAEQSLPPTHIIDPNIEGGPVGASAGPEPAPVRNTEAPWRKTPAEPIRTPPGYAPKPEPVAPSPLPTNGSGRVYGDVNLDAPPPMAPPPTPDAPTLPAATADVAPGLMPYKRDPRPGLFKFDTKAFEYDPRIYGDPDATAAAEAALRPDQAEGLMNLRENTYAKHARIQGQTLADMLANGPRTPPKRPMSP